MTARTMRILTVASAFVLGLALFGGAFFVGSILVSSHKTTPGSAIGGPFHLIDQDGKPISEQDIKGKPALIFFGFTHCPDVCPTSLFEMSQILAKLGADANKINADFITVDPERDTPAVMKDYLSSFDPHLRGITGDPAAIAKTLKEYRVYAKKVPLKGGDYTMDHTALVYLMDKDGHFVAPFNLKRKPEDAATDLRRYF